jgi:hypothetical protein
MERRIRDAATADGEKRHQRNNRQPSHNRVTTDAEARNSSPLSDPATFTKALDPPQLRALGAASLAPPALEPSDRIVLIRIGSPGMPRNSTTFASTTMTLSLHSARV